MSACLSVSVYDGFALGPMNKFACKLSWYIVYFVLLSRPTGSMFIIKVQIRVPTWNKQLKTSLTHLQTCPVKWNLPKLKGIY